VEAASVSCHSVVLSIDLLNAKPLRIIIDEWKAILSTVLFVFQNGILSLRVDVLPFISAVMLIKSSR
jgi:hypothetical protein